MLPCFKSCTLPYLEFIKNMPLFVKSIMIVLSFQTQEFNLIFLFMFCFQIRFVTTWTTSSAGRSPTTPWSRPTTRPTRPSSQPRPERWQGKRFLSSQQVSSPNKQFLRVTQKHKWVEESFSNISIQMNEQKIKLYLR